MKRCSKCEKDKPLISFSKRKTAKDGLQSTCKLCYSDYVKANKSKINERNKKYQLDNPQYFIEYRKNNSIYLKNKSKLNYEKNKNNISLIKKQNYKENSEKIKLKSSEYSKNNKDKIKKTKQEYREKNRLKLNEYNKNYLKNKRLIDNNYRLKTNLRSMMYRCFKNKKNKRTHDILGCSYEYFKTYLESKWESWMNWDNYGKYNGTDGYGWDIDHIIPISTAKTITDIEKLNHYTNLQPLCSYVNRIIKKDK